MRLLRKIVVYLRHIQTKHNTMGMKKNYLLIATLAVSLTGCMDTDVTEKGLDVDPEEGVTVELPSVLKNVMPTKAVEVPVKEGYRTIVYCDGEEIASTNYATEILVPSYLYIEGEMTTRAADPTKVLSFDYVRENGGQILEGNSHMYQTVCFEDSRSGENDYNDLIFQAKVSQDKNKVSVEIIPVALGSTKPIGLGYILLDEEGNEVDSQDMFSDVRTELFGLEELKFIWAYQKTGKSQTDDKGDVYFEYLTKNGKKVFATGYVRKGEALEPVVELESGDELIKATSTDEDGNVKQNKDYMHVPFINTLAVDKKDEKGNIVSTTYQAQSFVDRKTKSFSMEKTSGNSLKYAVIFYIKVDKKEINGKNTVETFYAYSWEKALNSQKIENFLTEKGLPMGICVSGANSKKSAFNYPRETVNIKDVYKNFNSWVSGEVDKLDVYETEKGTYFDALNEGIYDLKWKW